MSQKSKMYNKLYHESNGFKKRAAFASILITPQLAQELLELNTSNRNKRSIKKLTDSISNGTWIENGDSIRISTEGVILDGQHRLLSVISSGQSIRQDIATGLDPKAFQTIDIGITRTKSDTVITMGYKSGNLLSAIVSNLISYEINKDFHFANRKFVSNHDVAAYLECLNEREIEILQNHARNGQNKYNRSGKMFFSASTWGLIEIILSQINMEEALVFTQLLSTGDGISSSDSKTSAIYWLRQKLTSLSSNSNTYTRLNFKVALVFKAWNYYRQRKAIKQLSWDDRQDYPQPQ